MTGMRDVEAESIRIRELDEEEKALYLLQLGFQGLLTAEVRHSWLVLFVGRRTAPLSAIPLAKPNTAHACTILAVAN